MIAKAWTNKDAEDSPFKKLYIAWEAGIREHIKGVRSRRQKAYLEQQQPLVEPSEPERDPRVDALLKRIQKEKDDNKEERMKGHSAVAKRNSEVIEGLPSARDLGRQLPDLRDKLKKQPGGELDKTNPPDMTREEALIAELKRLTLVMLEMVISEKPTDGTKSEMDKKHNESIQLPFNHALRQIIDIYKGRISKTQLVEAIKETVLPKKFSEGTIEKIVVGMIGEVAVQDVARKMYSNEYVRDSTIKEDGGGNDFFVKVRVIDKRRPVEREFGIDVKTGLPGARVKDNVVFIDPKDINMDTFSIRRRSAVEDVQKQIDKVINGTGRFIGVESLVA